MEDSQMSIIIGIAILIVIIIVILIVVSLARGAGRGWKIAQQLHAFVATYQRSVNSGVSRDDALQSALQQLRQAPRFKALSDDDIGMVVRTLSGLQNPELLIEKMVMKVDSRKAVRMLKDPKFMKDILEIGLKYEEQ
jgi:hypothetical protein